MTRAADHEGSLRVTLSPEAPVDREMQSVAPSLDQYRRAAGYVISRPGNRALVCRACATIDALFEDW